MVSCNVDILIKVVCFSVTSSSKQASLSSASSYRQLFEY